MQKRNIVTDVENKTVTRGESREGLHLEIEIKTYTLLYIKLITTIVYKINNS